MKAVSDRLRATTPDTYLLLTISSTAIDNSSYCAYIKTVMKYVIYALPQYTFQDIMLPRTSSKPFLDSRVTVGN